ncbi:MAG: OsmC family protein [Actinomycetota bacterium]|nr:OsmC family protein [Actinomycetota bacterium]
MDEIRTSIENAVRYLSEHPDEARYTDSAATARIEEGLRVRVEGPDGASLVTDMPTSVGGGGSAPSAGWVFRAGLAGCVATLIAMEAAREGLTLDTLEVTADSESDDRGILGMDPSVPAGPLSMRVRVRAAAAGASPEQLRTVIERGKALCPVCDAAQREVPVTLEIEA